MRLLVLSIFVLSLSGCSFFSTRIDETRNTNMVREETIIREEIHEGQVVQLKEVRHTTEVTKEVAAIKSKTDVPVLGGFSMATTLSGGGIATLVLGYIGTKLRNMQPPTPKPAPVVQQVKGTREED